MCLICKLGSWRSNWWPSPPYDGQCPLWILKRFLISFAFSSVSAIVLYTIIGAVVFSLLGFQWQIQKRLLRNDTQTKERQATQWWQCILGLYAQKCTLQAYFRYVTFTSHSQLPLLAFHTQFRQTTKLLFCNYVKWTNACNPFRKLTFSS